MTEKEKDSIRERFISNRGRTLFDCYDKPSEKKKQVYLDILNDMTKHGGFDLTVLSYNTSMYTCAYVYRLENYELMIKYFSKSTTQEFKF